MLSYPSLTTSWGKQAEGATSKSSPHVKAQDSMDTSFPLPSAARLLGAATGSQKRSISFIPDTSSGSSNKVIKHSDVHSQHWTRALHLWCELCELTSACSRLLQDILHSDNRHALLENNFCDVFPITLLFVTLLSCGSCSRPYIATISVTSCFTSFSKCA